MGQVKSKGRANHLSGVGNFKVGREKVDLVERRINVLQAIENAKIDRSETCFKGFGYLAHEDLAQYMEALEEKWAETPW